ncbi:MAG: glycosyl hydrolase, repeat-containing protein [Actinomycetia bacterium]|nr:glycosyl hydrolase, repeat-containing protein [Actinomycetes bacterium]
MPADNELDPLDRWLNRQVGPLPPPPGTFELITRRARRRKIRKAVISVAGAAAVAAAVGVAVPVGMSLHLTTPSTNAGLAATGSSPGRTGGATQTTLGKASKEPGPSPSSAAASASGTATLGTAGTAVPRPLPPDYVPSSVTWDSLTTGWVMGPAGKPGHCGAQQDSAICTSIAITHDGGATWSGLPAPTTGGPDAATGVTGLRFLNGTYGWAFGPELWATANGGASWHKVDTGNSAVTDLETINGRGFALFGDCTPPAGTAGDTIANCSSFTLKTTTAGSDAWTPVGGVPANLTTGSAALGSALLELAGATGTVPATGYLVAPDGTLYAGPLGGGAWHKVAALPCAPGPAANDGQPQQVMLAPAGTTSAGGARLALVCATPIVADTVVYLSDDGGTSWAVRSAVGSAGTSHIGAPQSLTALNDGTLVLATEGSASGSGGIYLLAPGGSRWRAAGLSDPSGKSYGFTYVGMTSPTQGVALGGNPGLHAIWMTTDGGQTWQVRPIQG